MDLKVLGPVRVVRVWHGEARLVVGIRSHKMRGGKRFQGKREGVARARSMGMAVAVAVPGGTSRDMTTNENGLILYAG